MASGIELVANFAEQYRTQDDYLYLLVDGQAECALDHPLSVPSLIESLGAEAVTRVLRPDLAHSPEYCPALVQLAKPGESAARRYLQLSADYAEWDLVYRKRYICGWLLSPQPPRSGRWRAQSRCNLGWIQCGSAWVMASATPCATSALAPPRSREPWMTWRAT